VLRVTTRFLASGFGGGSVYWPDTGLAAIGLGIFSAWILGRRWWTQSEEFQRISGLSLFLAACGAMAFAVGWGRAGISKDLGFDSRHMVYSVLFVCCLHVVWTVCCQTELCRRALCIGTLLLVCLTAWRSYYVAVDHGREIRGRWVSFENDARSGLPSDLLARKHPFFPWPDHLEWKIEMLRKVGWGAFKDCPLLVDRPLEIQPAELHAMAWSGSEAVATGVDPYAVFKLDLPRRVVAARIQVELLDLHPGPAQFQVFWSHSGRRPFSAERCFTQTVPPVAGLQTLRLEINEEIDHLRLDPDVGNCRIALKSMTLFTPSDESSARVADQSGRSVRALQVTGRLVNTARRQGPY
jgi:hypothetical protein